MSEEKNKSPLRTSVFECGPVNVTRSTKKCWKLCPFLRKTLSAPECRSFNVAGVDASVEWYGEGSKFLVGLYTENNVLVGTAPRLLAQEQTCGQAWRLTHDGHVVHLPCLTVFVHHPEAPAGGTVPDALLGPYIEKREGDDDEKNMKLKWKGKIYWPEGVC